jgi:glycosyltransferase involved in cell wall biosynthesis
VVATDVGAAKEIIGTAGRVAGTDPKELVDCILSVVKKDHLEEMSQNAKSKITEYSSELYISQLLDLYRNIL